MDLKSKRLHTHTNTYIYIISILTGDAVDKPVIRQNISKNENQIYRSEWMNLRSAKHGDVYVQACMYRCVWRNVYWETLENGGGLDRLVQERCNIGWAGRSQHNTYGSDCETNTILSAPSFFFLLILMKFLFLYLSV